MAISEPTVTRLRKTDRILSEISPAEPASSSEREPLESMVKLLLSLCEKDVLLVKKGKEGAESKEGRMTDVWGNFLQM